MSTVLVKHKSIDKKQFIEVLSIVSSICMQLNFRDQLSMLRNYVDSGAEVIRQLAEESLAMGKQHSTFNCVYECRPDIGQTANPRMPLQKIYIYYIIYRHRIEICFFHIIMDLNPKGQ